MKLDDLKCEVCGKKGVATWSATEGARCQEHSGYVEKHKNTPAGEATSANSCTAGDHLGEDHLAGRRVWDPEIRVGANPTAQIYRHDCGSSSKRCIVLGIPMKKGLFHHITQGVAQRQSARSGTERPGSQNSPP